MCERTPRSVDQDAAALHRGKDRGADDPSRFGSERHSLFGIMLEFLKYVGARLRGSARLAPLAIRLHLSVLTGAGLPYPLVLSQNSST